MRKLELPLQLEKFSSAIETSSLDYIKIEATAQFLIDKNDLAKLDFSKVIYGWDCF